MTRDCSVAVTVTRRTESDPLSYGAPPQDSAVQETALWCTQPSLWRRKICPVRITEKKGRSGSPHQRTARGRDFAQRNRKATPGGAAQAARRRGSEFAKRTSSGDAQRRHRRSPRARTRLNGLTKKCSSEHRRGRGTLQRKVGKRLERRRGLGDTPRFKRICPDKKAGPATRGRPLNFVVTGGYYSSTIGLYLGTRAFMMLHAST